MNDKPIAARPASAGERALKFVRRNKILVGGLTAVIAVLCLGMMTTSTGLIAALFQANRASKAENEQRKKTFDLLAQNAALAVQQGKLKVALKAYDDALAAGHPDEVAMRLGRAQVLLSLNETAQARAEVDALAARSDLGKHEGSVLILRAELVLDGNEEEGLKLFRQALTKDLSKGEAKFAQAMLATNSEKAVDLYREALTEDPYHVRSRILLGMTLLFMGRLQEVRDLAGQSEVLFREDPNFKLLLAFALAGLGDRPGAMQAVEKMRGQVDAEQLEIMRGSVEGLALLSDAANDKDPNAATKQKSNWEKLQPLAARLMPEFTGAKGTQGAAAASDRMQVPPLVARSIKMLIQAALKSVTGDFDGAILLFQKTLKDHPEGFTYLLYGTALFQKQQFAEAEKAFLKAAQTPALINVKSRALFNAALCVRALLENEPNPDSDLRARGVKYVEQRYHAGPVSGRGSRHPRGDGGVVPGVGSGAGAACRLGEAAERGSRRVAAASCRGRVFRRQLSRRHRRRRRCAAEEPQRQRHEETTGQRGAEVEGVPERTRLMSVGEPVA